MTVNADISDLFFNYDLSHAEKRDEWGKFDRWDEDELEDTAHEFLRILSRLDVGNLPTADELVSDFLDRV